MHIIWDVKWQRSTPKHQIPLLHSQLTMKQDRKSKGICLNKSHLSLTSLSEKVSLQDIVEEPRHSHNKD